MQPRSRQRPESILESLEYLDRLSAKVTMPLPSCRTCGLFTPDTINPTTGMGACGAGRGYHYPLAKHRCTDRKPLSE